MHGVVTRKTSSQESIAIALESIFSKIMSTPRSHLIFCQYTCFLVIQIILAQKVVFSTNNIRNMTSIDFNLLNIWLLVHNIFWVREALWLNGGNKNIDYDFQNWSPLVSSRYSFQSKLISSSICDLLVDIDRGPSDPLERGLQVPYMEKLMALYPMTASPTKFGFHVTLTKYCCWHIWY